MFYARQRSRKGCAVSHTNCVVHLLTLDTTCGSGLAREAASACHKTGAPTMSRVVPYCESFLIIATVRYSRGAMLASSMYSSSACKPAPTTPMVSSTAGLALPGT